jgi:hypothetical protein
LSKYLGACEGELYKEVEERGVGGEEGVGAVEQGLGEVLAGAQLVDEAQQKWDVALDPAPLERTALGVVQDVVHPVPQK